MPERGYKVNCEELSKLVDLLHRDTKVSELNKEEIARAIQGKVPKEVSDIRIRLLYRVSCGGGRGFPVSSESLEAALSQLLEENPNLLGKVVRKNGRKENKC